MINIKLLSNRSIKTATITLVFILSFISLATKPVSADLVFPSVVRCLSAAGPYSIFLLPMIITIPLLLTISFIEAYIVKKILKPQKKMRILTALLFLINAFTSAIGLLVMPNGTELFPGIILAYLFTTIIEAFCLVFVYPKGERKIDLKLFKASAVMNGASYAFLCLLLITLIYLPAAMAPENLDKTKLHGTLIALNHNKPVAKIRYAKSNQIETHTMPKYKTKFINGRRYVECISDHAIIGTIPNRKYIGEWCFSSDGKYYTNRLKDYSTAVAGKVGSEKQTEFHEITDMSFCPNSSKVALVVRNNLVIFDLATNKKRNLWMHGVEDLSHFIAWSPDGRYLAYEAVLSPFTQWIGEVAPDAIRIISMDGREMTAHRFLKNEYFDEIRWLP